jgi:hypothetical protein
VSKAVVVAAFFLIWPWRVCACVFAARHRYVPYATRNGSTLGAFAKSVDSQGQDDDDEEEEAEEAEGGEKVAESDVDPRP